LIPAFEDDTVEFIFGDGDGEVGFCFSTGGKPREEFGVEEGDPGRLAGGAPVEEGEEGAC
jgi:hypothetical protein